LTIFILFTPLSIQFQLNLNTNTERVNSLNAVCQIFRLFILILKIGFLCWDISNHFSPPPTPHPPTPPITRNFWVYFCAIRHDLYWYKVCLTRLIVTETLHLFCNSFFAERTWVLSRTVKEIVHVWVGVCSCVGGCLFMCGWVCVCSCVCGWVCVFTCRPM